MITIGDTIHTVRDLREMIEGLDDNDQVCMGTIDLETGDVSDLFPFYIDVIDGIKLTDDTTVREVRFCQQKQSAWKEPIHKSPEPTEEDRFIMEYVCSECGTEWEMAGSCSCNDHCPQCDAEIEPSEVRDIE